MDFLKPLVSVCMITYNHEKYIVEAIEGVLMQEVDFEVEFVIADDASTDRTGEIIQSYIDTHPRGSWIKYTRHPVNKGMMGNFIWAIEQCKGEYVALCEGDDYWIESKKLIRQVSFLKENLPFSLVYHPTKILMPNGDLVDDYIAGKYFKAPESTIFDLAIFGNYIHTPSVVFRKANLFISENFSFSPIGDYFLYILVAQKGNISRLDFHGAVYRNLVGFYSSGSFSEKKKAYKKTLNLLSESVDNKLVALILKLRIYHNSLIGKFPINMRKNSGVADIVSFYKFVNKFELFKALIKLIFYKNKY